MKGKELLDLFYNDINYQSTTTEILLHDVNRLSNNLRKFKKLGNYKKYLLKISINSNEIKKIVKQFDSFLTNLITFYENINWNKEEVTCLKLLKQKNQKLYFKKVVGAHNTLLMFAKTEDFINNINRYEINDKINNHNVKNVDLLLKGICNNCKEI